MAKNRYVGHKALVKIDFGAGFRTMGVTRNFTLPRKSRARVDLTGLEDDSAVTATGNEQEREFSFQQVFDPNDADDAAVDTAYAAKTLLPIQVILTDGTTPITGSFSGKVADIAFPTVGGSDPFVRDITIVTTTDITWT